MTRRVTANSDEMAMRVILWFTSGDVCLCLPLPSSSSEPMFGGFWFLGLTEYEECCFNVERYDQTCYLLIWCNSSWMFFTILWVSSLQCLNLMWAVEMNAISDFWGRICGLVESAFWLQINLIGVCYDFSIKVNCSFLLVIKVQ